MDGVPALQPGRHGEKGESGWFFYRIGIAGPPARL